MSSNLSKRMERLEETLRALGKGDTDPLYARGSFDEPRPDTLDRLVAEGSILVRDRARVTFDLSPGYRPS
jgi:hypothetical protein